MRTYAPVLPVAPPHYSADDQQALRRELENILRAIQQARPEDFVTISTSNPSGTPRSGVGSLWIKV